MKGLEELTFDVPLRAPGPRSPAGVRWGCQGLSEAECVGAGGGSSHWFCCSEVGGGVEGAVKEPGKGRNEKLVCSPLGAQAQGQELGG